MKTIPLTRGLFAAVDDEDFEELSRFKWFAKPACRTTYAGRRVVLVDGKATTVGMHRVIMGAPIGLHVDHINGNGLDNRRCNLRAVAPSQNGKNITAKRAGCSSRFKGVCWKSSTSKWVARIRVDRKLIHLGYFSEETEARDAYARAAVAMFGEFAAPYVEAAE